MNIVSTTNDQYAQHLGVMLTSLLENTINREPIRIFIIDGGLSELNKSRLNKVTGRFMKKITFLKPDKKFIRTLPSNSTIGYITKETYYRIGLPGMLDERINKVLYLDCDLIVKEDISELWNTDIKSHVLAAVDESCLFHSHSRERLQNELGLPHNSSYFNAGVLLLNIEKWREYRVSRYLIKYLQSHPRLTFMDQDALNVVLRDDWLRLDYKWNYTSYHWDVLPNVNPAIIHFCGWYKPWNSEIRYKEEYDHYLSLSGWDQGDNP